MAKTRAIVKRRKAIRNIRKITRTMELIATAQFKKALDRATQAEAYTRKIAELAADLSANAGEIKHPLLQPHAEIKNSVLLVLCSNRGLCGGYNAAVLREAMGRIRQVKAEGCTLHLEASGKRALVYFRFQRMAMEQSYTRFEDKPGTNPEELIAAAHAGCFSMALSAELGKAGLNPQSVETAADLTLEMLPGGATITAIHLRVMARVPGADKAKFEAAAEAAKKGCPVSRLLNAKITMDAQLTMEAKVAG